jgi:hypothetical protein
MQLNYLITDYYIALLSGKIVRNDKKYRVSLFSFVLVDIVWVYKFVREE